GSAIEERGFEEVRRIRSAHSEVPLSIFKAIVREQFYMLQLDQEGALAAIPSMLPADADVRLNGFNLIKDVLAARGEITDDLSKRLERIAQLFGIGDEPSKTGAHLTLASSGSGHRKKSSAAS